jgi:ubiquinone/menaquinone biosynthesis C-methylase UbiE
LVKTGPVDHAEWNFAPVLGAIQRARFDMIINLMGGRKYGKLLEVGYGSGVFMPELRNHCEILYGIDIHHGARQVSRNLRETGTDAELQTANICEMPFKDRCFDGIVAVSTLEFLEKLDTACLELKRVLAPDGSLLVVVPGSSWHVDIGLRILTGKRAETIYRDRRDKVMTKLKKHFYPDKELFFPLSCRQLYIYHAARLTSPDQRDRPSPQQEGVPPE